MQTVAEENKDIDLEAAIKVMVDRFVDDLPTGADLKQLINRFRGAILENWQTSGTLARIFSMGGYVLKVVVCDGDQDQEMINKLGNAVLGVGWDATTDKFIVPLTVNISNRVNGQVSGPDITLSTVHLLKEAKLTRRIYLSIAISLYDPLGILAPV